MKLKELDMTEGLTGQLGQAPAQVGVHDGVHELHLTEIKKRMNEQELKGRTKNSRCG